MKKRGVFWVFLSCFLFLFSGMTGAEVLTLEKAIGEARSKSLVLKQSGEMVRAAEAVADEQRTYLFPSFNLSGVYTYQQGHVFSSPVPSGNVETDINTVALTVTQPIFTGGRLLGQYQSARLAIELARAYYARADLDLILNVNNAYFNVLRLEKAINVSRELVDNRQRHSSEVEKRVKAGVLPRVEQLKAEVELAHSEDGLISAENGLKAARSSLNRLLERPLDAETVLLDIVPELRPEDGILDRYYVEAQQNRPELRAVEIQVGQAEKGRDIARSGYFPQLFLQLAHEEFQDDAFDSDWSRNDRVMLTVSYDIWNWGRIKNRVRNSESQLSQARLGLSDLERVISLEVKNAYLAVRSALTRIETAQKAVSQAEEVLRMQSIRFKEGMATSTEVLDADFALARARTDYYNASYDYLSAEAVLKRAIGKE
ncbi:MAG: TolC family protein [Candidatus Omnitrophota bacterium]